VPHSAMPGRLLGVDAVLLPAVEEGNRLT